MSASDNVVPIAGGGKAPPTDSSAAGSGGDGGDGKPPKKKRDVDWDKLDWLTTNFALIYSTDTVWDDYNQLIMKISAMAHAHGADYVRMWKARDASPVRNEPERSRWTVLPENVVFDPTETSDPLRTVNLFGGLEMEPESPTGPDGRVDYQAAEAAVAPMLELARHLVSRVSEDEVERQVVLHWLLSWMAYPLKKPGAKMRTAIVVHGDEGAGKNFFFETYLEIFGKYGKAVGQDELDDKFNDWRSGGLFVLADEASSRQELVHNKNRLKSLITSPTVQINPKNLPRREEANHMNIVFLSNELQPLALDNTDRRYLVIFTPPARDEEFYKRLGIWRANGGARKWMYYLLHFPIGVFNMYAPAPITAAKRELVDLNRKTPERFWVEWSNGELALPYRSCSVDQAYRAYTRYAQRSGDRYPVQKALFSRMVTRISDSLSKPIRVKTMRVSDEADQERATRMLLVTDPNPPNGITEGQWASDAVQAFERDLRTYLHRPHSPESGPDGGSGE